MKNPFLRANGWVSKVHNLLQSKTSKNITELDAYRKSIDTYNLSQPNSQMLDAIRQYNHSIINSLNSIRPLSGLRILDVGASPHGYALEESLALGVSEYVGIGLDITENFALDTKSAHASLVYMNAESLTLNNEQFDAIVSMSTFEHIGNLGLCLSEFHRVLKRGGCTLISFEPIWTCSYGHHLHHLGEVSRLVPDWAHLLWSKIEMMEYLYTCWPESAALSVAEAGEWIYENNVLNRQGIREVRKILSDCPMHVEWIAPMLDESRNEVQLAAAVEKTGLSKNELMTKGLSALLWKH